MRSFYNAWQRKGDWLASSQKAVTVAKVHRVAKTLQLPKKQRWRDKEWDHDLTLKGCRSGNCGSLDEIMKTRTFMNFHLVMNFHETMKSRDHETLQLQSDCAAMEHGCAATKFSKNHEISIIRLKFYVAWLRRWLGSRALSLIRVSKVTVFRFMKTWPRQKLKGKFEGGCAAWMQSCARWSVVKSWSLDCHRSAMPGSAKAFGSRALERPSVGTGCSSSKFRARKTSGTSARKTSFSRERLKSN